MSTIPLVSCECVGANDGGPPTERDFPEGASVTAKVGEPVVLTAGYVVECGDDPAAILGILAEDAHNDASAGLHNIKVVLADERNIFSIQRASAAGTRAATAVTDVGMHHPLFRDTTNSKLQAGAAGAANGRVMCIGLDKRDVVGDTGGRLLVRFIGNNCQLASTS